MSENIMAKKDLIDFDALTDKDLEAMISLFESESEEIESVDRRQEEKKQTVSGDDDILPDFYAQYFRSIPVLTKEEEYALGVKLKEGTEEEKKEARNKLVEHNLRYVLKLSRRYAGHGLSIDDIIQCGAVGLMKAADKFDYELGYRFTTYATHWIRQSIVRSIETYGRAIYLPAYLYCDYAKIKKAEAALEGKYGNEEDHVNKLSQMTGFDEEKILYLREVMNPLTSLDLPVGTGEDRDATLMDYVRSNDMLVEEAAERDLLKEPIEQVIKEKLNEQEQDIIRKRYGLDGGEAQTLGQIGSVKKLSRERIRQVEARALEKLRRTTFAVKYRGYLN